MFHSQSSVVRVAASAAFIALLAACNPSPPAATSAAVATAAPLKPVASVLDLMLGDIDLAADFLWESVATITGEKGIEEKQPHTDAEWQEVRFKALALIEGANLLMMDGRRVAHPGQKLSEPGGEGDFTPDQAQAAMDGDRATFLTYARAMQDAAAIVLTAIEKRDPEALLEAGGGLDEACEQCHRRFWYPNAPLPPGA
jgi:hypothetical protein